jgi:heat shock factor-binding protein 1
MSTSIIGRIDEMGNRIDDLEKSIGDLMQQVWKYLSKALVR